MRPRILLGLALLLGLGGNLPAIEPAMRISQKKIGQEVKAVVAAQLAALQAGNLPAAYAFASRGIRVQFDERLFGLLMQRGYAPLLQHRQADLGLVHDNGAGTAELPVTVTDKFKRSTTYRYRLVQEEAGWRISGVVLEPRPPPADT
jgi:hypothetical protein